MVGVYNAAILCDSFPLTIPTFALTIKYLEPLAMDDVGEMTLRIFDVDGEIIGWQSFSLSEKRGYAKVAVELGLLKPEEGVDEEFTPMIWEDFHLRFSPFHLTRSGTIRVRVDRSGESIKLGSLRVATYSEITEESEQVREAFEEQGGHNRDVLAPLRP